MSELELAAHLADCRLDIQRAVAYASDGDMDRCRRTARRALSLANTVLVAPEATDSQREFAIYCQADAVALERHGVIRPRS